MIAEELERLNTLRRNGVLSDHEFEQAKQAVLTGRGDAATGGRVCGVVENTFLMLMHLSQLLTFAGGLGIAIPIIMWALGKDESRAANRHGLMIINWFLSALIYSIIGGLLCFVLIGIPVLIVLAIISLVFPIIGAVRANNGEFWRYPLTIEFFTHEPR